MGPIIDMRAYELRTVRDLRRWGTRLRDVVTLWTADARVQYSTSTMVVGLPPRRGDPRSFVE
jgi:hypothetical protein